MASIQVNKVDLWHQRLGHLNGMQVKEMILKEVVSGAKLKTKSSNLSFCVGYVEGKLHHKPLKPVGETRSTKVLELVHSDGPMQTESISGRRYFVTFIDDFSPCCRVSS